MILFINPISIDIHLTLLHGNSVSSDFIIPKGDDFSTFPEKIIEIINSFEIEEVWVICGPGAFTRMRIITLCINTLVITKGLIIKGCHFFDLIKKGIPILQINNSEYLIRDSKGENIFQNLNSLVNGEYCGYILKNDFTESKVFIQYTEDWVEIIKQFHNKMPEKSLSPLYFKSPHITGSKKNTFPSGKKMSK